MAVVESGPKSKRPPRSPALTPSRRILFASESPPRTKSEVCAPRWPSCDDDGAGHEPQGAHQVVTQGEVERAEHGGRRAGLRLWRGRPGRSDHDGLAHPLGLKHHVALNAVKLAGVEIWRLQLPKALGRDHEEKPAFGSGRDLKAAVGRGDGRGSDLSVADRTTLAPVTLAPVVSVTTPRMDAAWQAERQKRNEDSGDYAWQRCGLGKCAQDEETGMIAPSFPSERKAVEDAEDRSPDLRLFSHLPKARAHADPSPVVSWVFRDGRKNPG